MSLQQKISVGKVKTLLVPNHRIHRHYRPMTEATYTVFSPVFVIQIVHLVALSYLPEKRNEKKTKRVCVKILFSCHLLSCSVCRAINIFLGSAAQEVAHNSGGKLNWTIFMTSQHLWKVEHMTVVAHFNKHASQPQAIIMMYTPRTAALQVT